MRKLFAILIIGVIAFLVLYGLVPQVKATVNAFIIDAAGPTVFNSLNGAYTGILSYFGVGGFAAMVLGFGCLVGVVSHRLWVKADWSLRRKFATRTQKDLGVTPVSHIPSTPAVATTRPAPAPTPAPQAAPTPQPTPAKEKLKEEV